MTRRVVVCLLALLLGVVGTSAFADRVDRRDPDDTTGVLDVGLIAHGHDKVHFRTSGGSYTQKLLVHTITMRESWDNDLLRSGNKLWVYFNLDRDGKQERSLLIRANPDGSLYGEMFAGPTGGSYVRGYARIWRPDDRTLKLAFPAFLLDSKLDTYRWRVYTAYSDPADPTCPCEDFAPDLRYLRHR